MSLSAVLKQNGYKTKLIITNLNNPDKKSFRKIAQFKPDIIALPVFTGWQKEVISFCKFIKKNLKNVITVAGGPHATYFPKLIGENSIDYICIGEGEISFLKLVKQINNEENQFDIPGILNTDKNLDNSYTISEQPDLTLLPHGDINLYCEASSYLLKSKHREFSFQRGCIYNCSFCSSPQLNKTLKCKKLRHKTVAQVIDEIKYVYNKYPFKTIYFLNDNFLADKEYIYSFLEEYTKKINLPYTCQTRSELIDKTAVKVLKSSNCIMVSTGIESGNFKVRKDILNRKTTDEKLIKGCNLLKSKGIWVHTYNMTGIPGESFEQSWKTVELNRTIKPNSCYCTIFQPLPGTDLTNDLIKKAILTEDIFNEVPASFFEKCIMPYKKPYRFKNLQRYFQTAVSYPKITPLLKILCEFNIPVINDALFFMTFYRYYNKAHSDTKLSDLIKLIKNAVETKKAGK